MDIRRRPRGSASSNRPSASAIDSDDLLSFQINFNLIILSGSVAYILFRWREKIRTSVPLNALTLHDLFAILLVITSSIALVVFCFAKYSYKPDDDIDQDRTIHRSFPNSITPNLYRPLPQDEDEDEGEGEGEDEDEDDIINRVVSGEIPSCSLEDCSKAAEIRREVLPGRSVERLPLEGFDYESIFRQATTDGCLVASTTRGCKEFYMLLRDGITRAPVVRFSSAKILSILKFFLEDPLNYDTLSTVFNKSSRFARLEDIKCGIAGKNLYIRFRGNFCPNKKPAAVNCIQGRGKSVVCKALLPGDVVNMVLTGSAISGSLGGFNANIVSAVFLSTGQNAPQSSHCITMMEAVNDGKDLHVSVTMPSIQVGTQLASLLACPNLLGVKGTRKEPPGSNSQLLAPMVAVSVLAVEFSLMSAIAFVAGRLVKICMQYNRPSNDTANLGSYPPNTHSLTSS